MQLHWQPKYYYVIMMMMMMMMMMMKVDFMDNKRQKDTQYLHERWQRNKLQTKVDWKQIRPR